MALPTDVERRARAGELFQRGEEAYRNGDYQGALQLWLQCSELARLPLERARVLWNLAQAYRQLGDCAHAREKYRQYVDLPEGEEARDEAQSWLDELDAKCAASSPPPARAPAPVAPWGVDPRPAPIVASDAKAFDEPGPNARSWLAWSALAAGAATAMVSAGYAWAGYRAERDVRRLAKQELPSAESRSGLANDPALGDQLASLQRDGRSYNVVAWLLGGSAVLLAGTGATLLLLPKPDPSTPSHVTLSLGSRTALGLECGGEF